jgi:tyrosyl-tRNA synthetase
VQGYDFYWLYKNKNCKLQMGGSDQWGNIVTGTELIRRKHAGEAFAFTCPLIKKADGTKFGKSEQGNVWLDATKTTPYHFYQFWLNASDQDATAWIKIFTFLSRETIEELLEKNLANPSDRLLQKTLAKELTIFVHGNDEYQKALETTAKLFSSQNAAPDSLTEDDLNNMEGIIKTDFPASKISTGLDVVSFLAETNIFPSKGEARKSVQGGGVSINRKKIERIDMQVDSNLLLHQKYLLLQKGKKHYYLVKMV